MPLPADLLAILACPVPECRAALVERDGRLACTRCGLEYRIEHGWPVLIPDEAERRRGCEHVAASRAGKDGCDGA